jgi:hypothetical protein
MTAVIICLSIAIMLLFVTMVLSSMSASDVKKGSMDSAHKYAMWSAVVSGLAVFLLVIALIIYINSSRIVSAAHVGIQQGIGQYQGVYGRQA